MVATKKELMTRQQQYYSRKFHKTTTHSDPGIFKETGLIIIGTESTGIYQLTTRLDYRR
jgi:hypothetical protein